MRRHGWRLYAFLGSLAVLVVLLGVQVVSGNGTGALFTLARLLRAVS